MAAKVARILRLIAEWLSPSTDLSAQLKVLLSDAAYQPLLRAIRKNEADPILASANAETKRKQALEWAEHFSTKKVAQSDAWKTRFLLELILGIEKGKLK